MKMIQKWFYDFRCGQWRRTIWTPKRRQYTRKREKFHDIMLNDFKVNLRGLAETKKVSYGSVLNIMHYTDIICFPTFTENTLFQ